MKKIILSIAGVIMVTSVCLHSVSFAQETDSPTSEHEQQLIEKFEKVFTKFAAKHPEKVGVVALRLELLLKRMKNDSPMYGIIEHLVDFVNDMNPDDDSDDEDDDSDDEDNDSDDEDDDSDDEDDDSDDEDDDSDDEDNDSDDEDDSFMSSTSLKTRGKSSSARGKNK